MQPNFQSPMHQDMMNMMAHGAVDPYFYINSGYPRQPVIIIKMRKKEKKLRKWLKRKGLK